MHGDEFVWDEFVGDELLGDESSGSHYKTVVTVVFFQTALMFMINDNDELLRQVKQTISWPK